MILTMFKTSRKYSGMVILFSNSCGTKDGVHPSGVAVQVFPQLPAEVEAVLFVLFDKDENSILSTSHISERLRL